MKFTDSQKDFILDFLTTEITNKEIYIKYLTDKAEKENNIQLKNSIRKSVEYAVKKLEELDPKIARNIKPSDKQRIFRFLNICMKYNIKPSSFIYDKPKSNKLNFLKICINEESRDSLIKKINMFIILLYIIFI